MILQRPFLRQLITSFFATLFISGCTDVTNITQASEQTSRLSSQKPEVSREEIRSIARQYAKSISVLWENSPTRLVKMQKLNPVDETPLEPYVFLWEGRLREGDYGALGPHKWRILIATIRRRHDSLTPYVDSTRSSPTANLPIDAPVLVNADYSSGFLHVTVIEYLEIDAHNLTEKRRYSFKSVAGDWKVTEVETIWKDVSEPIMHRMTVPD